MQILEMLKEEGFKQTTNRVTSVFFETSQRTFNELFGKYMSDVLIDNFFTSEIHGKREPFSSYDAFDRWLLDYFHADGTEKILQKIRQNIQDSFAENSNLSLEEVLKKNQKQDVYDFIHNIRNKEHPLLLFYDSRIRDEILNEFFSPKFTHSTITGCFTHTPENYHCDQTITYDEIHSAGKLDSQKIIQFFDQVYDSKPQIPPRFACEDTSWFAESGFFEEHQQIGNKMSSLVLNNSIIMCCYDLTRLNKEQIITAIRSRNYVVLEEPFCVFVKEDLT